jgi:para-nitrobenzyl esterase
MSDFQGPDEARLERSRLELSRRAAIATAFGGAITMVGSKSLAARRADPVATTRFGRVSGTVEDGVRVFKGIRYGADTRPRRFLPPLPPESWSGIAPARAYGPASPQRQISEPTSEDCLFLNVWTPALRDGGRRPVMVYLHGGAHSSGSGSDPVYDGVRLCRRGDVVVVTLNHRLNAFGYCYLYRLAGARYASANVGTLDIVLALQWVRDNIAEFGGDPGQVMIFGQSGGGGKVDTLMAMPVARGLFHRAATMSGSSVTGSGPLGATRRARSFMQKIGLRADEVAALMQLPTERLVEGLDAIDPGVGEGRIVWGPVLDHQSLPRHPFYPDATPLSADIPMLIGSTRDETRYFLRSDAKAFDLSWEELPDKLAREMVADIGPEYVIARYRELYPSATPSEILFAASSVSRSWRGHLEKSEMRARQNGPTWVYQLDYASPVEGGKYRAFHTLDIGLVFDNVDKPGAMTGTDTRARTVAAAMSDTFIRFARSGNPNGPLPPWPRYDLQARNTMIFDVTPKLEQDPRREERLIFSAVPYVKPGT